MRTGTPDIKRVCGLIACLLTGLGLGWPVAAAPFAASAAEGQASEGAARPGAALPAGTAHSIWRDGRSGTVTKILSGEWETPYRLSLRLAVCERGAGQGARTYPRVADCEAKRDGHEWHPRTAHIYAPAILPGSVRVEEGSSADGTKGLRVVFTCTFDRLCGQIEAPAAWISARSAFIPCATRAACGRLADALREAAAISPPADDMPLRPAGLEDPFAALAPLYYGASASDEKFVVANGWMRLAPEFRLVFVSYACGYAAIERAEAQQGCRSGEVEARRMRIVVSLADLDPVAVRYEAPTTDGQTRGHALWLMCKGTTACISNDGEEPAFKQWHIACRDEAACAVVAAAIREARGQAVAGRG